MKSVADEVKIGDVVRAKVINVDDNGRIKLSIREAKADAEKKEKEPVGAKSD